jgi:hypothetical protein
VPLQPYSCSTNGTMLPAFSSTTVKSIGNVNDMTAALISSIAIFPSTMFFNKRARNTAVLEYLRKHDYKIRFRFAFTKTFLCNLFPYSAVLRSMDQRFLRLYGEVSVADLSLCTYSFLTKLCDIINRQRHTPHLETFQQAVRTLLWRILPDYAETPQFHAEGVHNSQGCHIDERASWSHWLQSSYACTVASAQGHTHPKNRYHFDVCLRL